MLDNADTPISERAEMGVDLPLAQGFLSQKPVCLSCKIHNSACHGLEKGSEGRCPLHISQKFKILKGELHEGYVQGCQPQG